MYGFGRPLAFALVLLLGAGGLSAASSSDVQRAKKAVVKIETTFFRYSYKSPWKQPALRRSSGTGFIIKGNRIVTNAHVVSQANTLRVKRPDQKRDYQARVLFIAHDCDLAMLAVDDPAFFAGSMPLEIARKAPELQSPVVVIGFPIGGNRVSLTRGIVSRMDMDRYSHSQVDFHLAIQVDAAINPGNSGGPALQDGRVIGVAFQVLTSGENLGYLIPPAVVWKFLTDVEDGRYNGYIDLGIMELNTKNPSLQSALGLDELERPLTGVLVYSVIPGSSAEGHIQPGDVLLSVNGHKISHDGDVEVDGRQQSYAELIDNFSEGQKIKVEIFRDGKRKRLSFPAKRATIIDFQRMNYDTPPPYFLFGGLLFQPVDANLNQALRRTWTESCQVEVQYRYRYFLLHKIYNSAEQDVVLTRRLGDPVNLYADDFVHGIVEQVNGKRVRNFRHFMELVDGARKQEKFVVVKFRNEPIPLILRAADLDGAAGRIRRSYGIPKDRFLPAGY